MILFIQIIIILIYLFILIWFSNSIYYHNNKNNQEQDYFPNVSILIAARNEYQNLSKLLNALIEQNYPINKYQIIVINDRSTDDSRKLLEFFQKKLTNLKLIHINKTPLGWSNKKWALTQGVKNANSDIILQTDADCTPSPNWIKTMVSYFKNKNVGFVCGASPLTHQDPLLNKIFQMESLIQESINAGAIKNNLFVSCTGRNISFRKKYFTLIEGYTGNESIVSGDDDLLLQKFALETDSLIKYSIDSDSLIESPAPSTFKSFLKQRFRFASKGLLYYQIKTTTELKLISLLLIFSNFVFVLSIFLLISIGNLLYLIPISIKMVSDFILSTVFLTKVGRDWSLSAFLILTCLHPFYILIFGLLGPFIKVDWRK